MQLSVSKELSIVIEDSCQYMFLFTITLITQSSHRKSAITKSKAKPQKEDLYGHKRFLNKIPYVCAKANVLCSQDHGHSLLFCQIDGMAVSGDRARMYDSDKKKCC